ncbi:hypothetical protein GCM10009549_20970 [Streptomyces thermoalcalitolerans]|uniref:Uncharacterized protein n=1 Tax=Streptomyces thermoalcalitolerans TaxID=65605 RepID=A0ABN1NLJ0_9ACTN
MKPVQSPGPDAVRGAAGGRGGGEVVRAGREVGFRRHGSRFRERKDMEGDMEEDMEKDAEKDRERTGKSSRG